MLSLARVRRPSLTKCIWAIRQSRFKKKKKITKRRPDDVKKTFQSEACRYGQVSLRETERERVLPFTE